MPLTATAGSSREPIPEGVHIGVCYSIMDLGTQHSEVYGKDSRKVLIAFELADERIEYEKDGKKVNLPRAISKQYTLSLHKKASLRQHLEAWRGQAFTDEELQGFDLKCLIGLACQVSVTHTSKEGNTYANIQTLMGLPKGMTAPKMENESSFFSFEDEERPPENTPDWIVEKMQNSREWHGPAQLDVNQEPVAPEPTGAVDDDNLPF